MRWSILAMALLTARLAAGEAPSSDIAAPGGPPTTVPTFHCLSVYWSPAGGDAAKHVDVKFRQVGQTAWRDGLPMRFNPVKTPECKGDYRGSIVDLKPATTYEIELKLEGADAKASIKATTWSETFPVGKTVKCQSGATTLEVKQSGKPDGYVLFDGTGCTIDGGRKAAVGIAVDANYVILRGFTIRDVTEDGIRILQGHHIVVERCDISGWGSNDGEGFGVEMQAAVYSKNHDVHALVVQRCKLHHPASNSNSWAVKHSDDPHPAGPQAIVLWETPGNNVFRYNECWSDDKHYFDDVLGGAFNTSYRGYPGADSDIYGNYVADCWDDGIEAEGGGQNVRLWNNYITDTMVIIANAATTIGPLYIWRNVGGRSFTPPGSAWGMTHGGFMKMGYADNEKWMTGHMYVFDNTIFQPNGEGADGLGGDDRAIKHCTTRNNILQSRQGDSNSISTEKKRSADDDYDYDLLSGRYPDGQEQHGVKGTPTYVAGAGFSFEKQTGDFRQAPESAGTKKGVRIPNFCELDAPDMGAQQAGEKPMVYGVAAEFVPTGAAAPTHKR